MAKKGKINRVLLVVPPTGKFIREDRCQTPIEDLKTVALRPPINLMYAAAEFEAAKCTCRVLDCPAEEKGWENLEREVKQFKPELIVISATTPSLDEDLRVAELAKKILGNDVKVLAKGAHFNVRDVEAMERFRKLDGCLRGEYELTCREIGEGVRWEHIKGITFRNQTGQIITNAAGDFISNLDELPFPARHLVRNELYIRPDTGKPQTTVITNRGCPFECTFCLSGQVAGQYNRVRSVENVVAELDQCVHKFGIRSFLFRSDLFTANTKWVIRLCQAIIEKGLAIEWACNSRVDTLNEEMLGWMKRAHCWLIAFGVEKAEQRMLDLINKRQRVEDTRRALDMTRRAGIKSSIYFLFGLPWDNEESLRADIRLAKELEPDFLEIFYVYPFPGTRLHEQAVELGLLREGEYPRQAFGQPAMPTLHLSKEELGQWRRRALKEYYLRPRIIAKTLYQARSPRVFFNYVKYGVVQLMDLLSHR